jgi:hypothetical protein
MIVLINHMGKINKFIINAKERFFFKYFEFQIIVRI